LSSWEEMKLADKGYLLFGREEVRFVYSKPEGGTSLTRVGKTLLMGTGKHIRVYQPL